MFIGPLQTTLLSFHHLLRIMIFIDFFYTRIVLCNNSWMSLSLIWGNVCRLKTLCRFFSTWAFINHLLDLHYSSYHTLFEFILLLLLLVHSVIMFCYLYSSHSYFDSVLLITQVVTSKIYHLKQCFLPPATTEGLLKLNKLF